MNNELIAVILFLICLILPVYISTKEPYLKKLFYEIFFNENAE